VRLFLFLGNTPVIIMYIHTVTSLWYNDDERFDYIHGNDI